MYQFWTCLCRLWKGYSVVEDITVSVLFNNNTTANNDKNNNRSYLYSLRINSMKISGSL